LAVYDNSSDAATSTARARALSHGSQALAAIMLSQTGFGGSMPSCWYIDRKS